MPSGAAQLKSSLNACGWSEELRPNLFESRLAFGSLGSAIDFRLPERITPSSRDHTYDPVSCQLLVMRLVTESSNDLYSFDPGTVCRRNASRPRNSGFTLYIVIVRSSPVFRMLSGPASGNVPGVYPSRGIPMFTSAQLSVNQR